MTNFSHLYTLLDNHYGKLSSFTFQFDDDSFTTRPINGSMDRPVIISRNNKMKVIFSTGHHFLGDQSRYMGFKFKYTFYRGMIYVELQNMLRGLSTPIKQC